MSASATRDHWSDAELFDEATVFVVVVAAVGEQPLGSPPRPARTAANGRHSLEQVEQLGDVVAVGAGECPGERDAAAVYEEMVLAAPPAAIDGAGTRFRAPFFACK